MMVGCQRLVQSLVVMGGGFNKVGSSEERPAMLKVGVARGRYVVRSLILSSIDKLSTAVVPCIDPLSNASLVQMRHLVVVVFASFLLVDTVNYAPASGWWRHRVSIH